MGVRASQQLSILSKDSDFYQRSLLFGPPPKLIWLRIGNCTRDDLIALLIYSAWPGMIQAGVDVFSADSRSWIC
jgi:predicted nuclease of predicted toxin-antitoxin system